MSHLSLPGMLDNYGAYKIDGELPEAQDTSIVPSVSVLVFGIYCCITNSTQIQHLKHKCDLSFGGSRPWAWLRVSLRVYIQGVNQGHGT